MFKPSNCPAEHENGKRAGGNGVLSVRLHVFIHLEPSLLKNACQHDTLEKPNVAFPALLTKELKSNGAAFAQIGRHSLLGLFRRFVHDVDCGFHVAGN